MSTRTEATIEDLYNVPENGKAEIVDGELVLMSPTGDLPGSAASEIFVSLREHSRRTGYGRAYNDNIGFVVNLPNRKSFSPDACLYVGPRTGGNFLEGAPVFAVEVRSESDYGPKAEQAMARKRRDYFAAGTKVVWDVDVLKGEVIRVYRFDNPETPQVFGRGQMADAEPAVPEWAITVDDLFL
ncbi:MAG TPA: Uma2 family endonuclease [Blastocatellia bacterium]|nr:Uma2 family endonuclease [Blastocatellia bacterium]